MCCGIPYRIPPPSNPLSVDMTNTEELHLNRLSHDSSSRHTKACLGVYDVDMLRLPFSKVIVFAGRFLTENLGVVSYPAYRVHRTRPVFADRDALLAYEACLKEAAILDEALEVGNASSSLGLLVLLSLIYFRHMEMPCHFRCGKTGFPQPPPPSHIHKPQSCCKPCVVQTTGRVGDSFSVLQWEHRNTLEACFLHIVG